MIVEASVYLIVFGITSCLAFVFQNFYNLAFVKFNLTGSKKVNTLTYCILGCLFLIPIIAMFALRYGIGTDYHSYESIFDAVHNSTFESYFNLHDSDNSKSFYIEFGYFLLNILFPTFRALLWGIGILIISFLLLALKEYSETISFSFAIFIYLATQFIYLMNGMRFAIAIVFALIGYVYLSKNKTVPFIIFTVLAVLFHKSCLICFAMYFLKQVKHKGINNTRNILMFVGVISFPFLSKYLLKLAEKIPFFERYFSKSVYSASESISFSWVWLLHIIPILLPLVIFCRKEIFSDEETNTFFRICVMEIPLRMLGLFNTWYTRLSRISQIAYVIFIPLVISKVDNRYKKTFLYLYFVFWFTFDFIYYAIVNDQGASLPYTWIFNM